MRLIDDDVDLSAYMSEPEGGYKVRKASDWGQDLIDHFHASTAAPQVTLGWRKTYGKFELRGGEVTVWAGPNGQGKSMLTGQVALDLCQQGKRVCMASMEMKPVKTLGRMAQQTAGESKPSPDFIRALQSWTDGKLWVYDHLGSVRPASILAVIRYAIKELGIDHFFIDNLQMVIEGEDDYNGQKAFMTALCTIARDSGAGIHLIHHTRKGDGGRPRKSDIKGASSITDLADNVFTVSKNERKEDLILGKLKLKPIDGDAVMLEPDVFLDLLKQRHGEFEGVFGLWFHPDSLQYLEAAGDAPKPYRIRQRPAVRPHSEVVNLEGAF